MSYKPKYCLTALKHPMEGRSKSVPGPKPDPENWTDEALMARDIHHSWLKHRCQAKFRGEDYSLTREEWESLWTPENWVQRGRDKDSLCLMQIDRDGGWHLNNVVICTRHEYLKRGKEYRERNND